jgi:hypothetical protein
VCKQQPQARQVRALLRSLLATIIDRIGQQRDSDAFLAGEMATREAFPGPSHVSSPSRPGLHCVVGLVPSTRAQGLAACLLAMAKVFVCGDDSSFRGIRGHDCSGLHTRGRVPPRLLCPSNRRPLVTARGLDRAASMVKVCNATVVASTSHHDH